MLLTQKARPFSGDYWFELKYDGWRVLALRSQGSVQLVSRHGTDLTSAFPDVVGAVSVMPPGTALDCELVVLNGEGKPVFDALPSRAWRRGSSSVAVGVRSTPATLMAFDLLYLAGRDARSDPIEERKAAIERAVLPGPHLLPVLPIAKDGHWLFKQAEALALEGIVAKRYGSTYRRGRTADWLKIKTAQGEERERGRRPRR